jgi:hypothetical protein
MLRLRYAGVISILVMSLSTPSRAANSEPPAGIWEMPVGSGAVGINIFRSGAVGSRWNVGVYLRKNTELRCGDENFFSTEPAYQSDRSQIFLDGQILRISHASAYLNQTIDVNLQFDTSTNTWRGEFRRGSFDMDVTLQKIDDKRRNDSSICTK